MTSKAVKRTPHNYSVSRNIRQNRDNTDKALLLFGSAEVTGPIPVSSSGRTQIKAFQGNYSLKCLYFYHTVLFTIPRKK